MNGGRGEGGGRQGPTGRIRRLFRLVLHDGWSVRRDLDEEVRLHVELRAEQLKREGMEPAEARREAERLFARGPETLRSLHRTARKRSRRMGTRQRLGLWAQDARNAGRGLIRDPLLAGFVVVTLALGLAAVVTSWSLVDGLLLRDPAHVSAPAELVKLFGTTHDDDRGSTTSAWIPYGAYAHIRDGLTTVDAIGAYRTLPRTVGEGLDAGKLRVAEVLDGFFPALEARPRLGRFFAPGEDDTGSGALAVVSERLWRQRFGGDPSAVGGTLRVDGAVYTVVGVAPDGFTGPDLRRVDAWFLGDRSGARNTGYHVVARLADGVEAPAVSAEATAIHARTQESLPSWFRWFNDAEIRAGSLRLGDDGQEPLEATTARWLTASSVLLLLVSLGNVANLLLARLARRRRELAVRVTLGSGRGGILRLLGLEGGLLALLAGAAALPLVAVAEPVVRNALMAGEAPWSFSMGDARLLAVLLGLVVLTAVAIAAAPALQAGGDRLTSTLRGGSGGAGRRTSRVRSGLTILQASLSVVLLVGAGLFLRSMDRVRSLDLGVDRHRVLAVAVDLPRVPEHRGAGEIDVFNRMADRARSLPGVEAAAVAIGTPLDGGAFGIGVHVPGRDSLPALPGGGPFLSAVGADYFRTLGTAILEGRPIESGDHGSAEPVVVINETMARTLWPDGNALGACARVGDAERPCARIIGIAADVHRVGLDDAASFQVYLPIRQQTMIGGATLLVRSARTGAVAGRDLRAVILDEVPAARLVEVAPLADRLSDELRPLRLGTVSFGLVSAVALVVALLGLYSVLAYMVAWRTRELGVRAALGATSTRLTRSVIGTGTGLAATGVAAGLVLAAIASRWIEPHLFRTRGTDPVVFAAVAALLLAVAVVASWIPARRAARISPTEALRAE